MTTDWKDPDQREAALAARWAEALDRERSKDALIADLLAALESLYAVTPHTPPAFGPAWREQHMAALAMAEAAIARAKGEALDKTL